MEETKEISSPKTVLEYHNTTGSGYQIVYEHEIGPSAEEYYSKIETVSAPKPKLYFRRWLVLLIFSLNGLNCSYYQMTYTSIQSVALKYWDLGSQNNWKVSLTSTIFMIAYIPFSPLATLLLHKKGLKFAVHLATWLNFIGGLLRLLCFPNLMRLSLLETLFQNSVFWQQFSQQSLFWVFGFTGQLLSAIGQPLLNNGITLLSNNWFGEKERTIATSIAAFLNILGSGVSFAVAPTLAGNGTEWGMLGLFGSQFIYSAILLVLTVAIVQEKPPTPPSLAQIPSSVSIQDQNTTNVENESETTTLLQTPKPSSSKPPTSLKNILWQLLRNKDFLILLFTVSTGFGVFSTVLTLLNQIIIPRGYTIDDGSYFGMIVIGMGLIGAIFFGVIVDLTKRYHICIYMASIGAVAGFVWFCILLLFEKTQANFVMICVSLALLGGSGIALVPISLELSVELTYPIPEEYCNGLIYQMGTVMGILSWVIMSALQSPYDGSMQNALWFALATFVVGTFAFLFCRGKYNRKRAEDAKKTVQQ